jgi:hypothetical protein
MSPPVEILADQAPKHFEHAFHGSVQVEQPRRNGLAAAWISDMWERSGSSATHGSDAGCTPARV